MLFSCWDIILNKKDEKDLFPTGQKFTVTNASLSVKVPVRRTAAHRHKEAPPTRMYM
jgi:hypothetical protein